jgi:hypothetical protein
MSRSFAIGSFTTVAIGTGTVATRLAGASGVSVFAWIKHTTTASNQVIIDSLIDSTNNIGVRLFSGTSGGIGQINFATRRTATDTTTQSINTVFSVVAGVWYPVLASASFLDRTHKGYLGNNVATTVFTSSTSGAFVSGTPTGTDRIGTTFANGAQFNGLISHLSVWNRELTGVEATMLAAGVSPQAIPNGLSLYFPMQDPQGIYDVVGGVQGTITGSVPIDEDPRSLWTPSTFLAPKTNIAKTVALLEAA